MRPTTDDLTITHIESLSLVSFPTELAQAILSHAPDFISLRALTLSNSFFYHAFLTAQNLILNKIVSNKFPASTILSNALITFTSARFLLQIDSQIRDNQLRRFLLDFMLSQRYQNSSPYQTSGH